jgi:hypothetical protein
VAIEFKHNGKLWRADTVEEALALRQRLEARDRAAIEEGEEIEEVQESVWTPDAITDLLSNAGQLQKMFLLLLTEHDFVEEGKLTSEALVRKLRIDSELSLAGIISGLSKQLKKMSLSPYDVYDVEVTWLATGKERSFKVNWNFLCAAQKVGWPEVWMGKKKK